MAFRNLDADNNQAGAYADLFSSQGRADFEATFSSIDQAPEFKTHPALQQLLADYNYDPLALARFVFNEIELTDYVGTHPAIDNGIPAEVQLGGLRRDALAVFLEGQGSPREICVLLAYLLRLRCAHCHCGVCRWLSLFARPRL